MQAIPGVIFDVSSLDPILECLSVVSSEGQSSRAELVRRDADSPPGDKSEYTDVDIGLNENDRIGRFIGSCHTNPLPCRRVSSARLRVGENTVFPAIHRH